jgi:hypothetical protein
LMICSHTEELLTVTARAVKTLYNGFQVAACWALPGILQVGF